jgi:sporulation protein YlmC with PRC-barrel domain
MRTLMGLVTPVIMAVLGREQRAAGLDASGLARMLMGQKDETKAAMPAGLSQILETSGLHEDIASRAAPERRQYEPTSTGYYAAARQQARGETNWWRTNWPYGVVPLLALAGLLWYLLPRERETVAVDTSKTTTEPMRDAQTKSVFLSSAPDNWVSIGSAPNDYVNKEIYNRAGEQLGTIKDVLVGPDGKMTAAIINVGRYLGIGDKEIAVPFSAIQQQRGDSGLRIVIDATKDNLQAAPAFMRQSKR